MDNLDEYFPRCAKDLSANDDALLQKESILNERFQRAERSNALDHETREDSLDDAPDTNATSSASSVIAQAPTVHLYYEKYADANKLRDAILSFEGRHQRERNRRERLGVENQPIYPLEKEFVEQYLKGRRDRILSFRLALAEAELLRNKSVEDGHKVRTLDIPPFDEDFLDNSHLVQEAILRQIPSERMTARSHNDVDALLVSDVDPRSRVTQWLEEIPAENSQQSSKAPQPTQPFHQDEGTTESHLYRSITRTRVI